MTATEVERQVSSEWGDMERWLFHAEGDLTKDQTRAAVSKARRYEDEFFRIVGQLHERRAWVSLGYGSWREFVLEEFGIKRTRAYQLVDQHRVNAALRSGQDEASDEPAEPVLTEAQARPLAKLKDDERAVRQVWARAQVLAGEGEPTGAVVEQAVAEFLEPPEFVRPEQPLVTNRVVWASGPVWWFWTTPAEGTVLEVGLGADRNIVEMQRSAYFRSEPRVGDCDTIREQDAAGLLPWLIAELLTGGCEMPDEDLVAGLVEQEFTHLGRGPHQVDKADVLEAGWDVGPGEWRPIDDDQTEAEADSDDDEVLRGELVDDTTPQSPDGSPEPIPPGSTPPGPDEVEDRARPPASSASSTTSVLLEDLAVMDADAVRDALEVAVDVGWNSDRPDDCEFAAAWLRASASFVMNRKTQLERDAQRAEKSEGGR